jgi:hypothetical protein
MVVYPPNHEEAAGDGTNGEDDKGVPAVHAEILVDAVGQGCERGRRRGSRGRRRGQRELGHMPDLGNNFVGGSSQGVEPQVK